VPKLLRRDIRALAHRFEFFPNDRRVDFGFVQGLRDTPHAAKID
jgi:hypothetical protein